MKPPTALDPVQVQREIGLRGKFHAFVRMAFPYVEPGGEFVDGWHIEEVCAHLEAMYRGELRSLAIAIPPGCMKSLIVSVLFPVWCWIKNPALRFSAISYDAELTGTRDGGKVAKLVQSDWFKARWGDRVRVPTDPAMSNVTTQAEGFRFATSIKGKYTGRHVHFEILDDPTKPQDLSKNALEEVQTWRQRVAPTRLLPVKKGQPGGRIYIMQRLHEDDAIGQALKEEKADPGSWVFLTLPMQLPEPDKNGKQDICRTPWGGDRRTVTGELLWPERFDAEEVRSRRKKLGPKNAAAQFDQKPTPDGGLVFNGEDFRYYKVAPARFDEMIISVDAAFKDLEQSDKVCIGVWGRRGGEFYLLDCAWRRMSFTATVEALKTIIRRWPRARAKLVEDKANGSAILDTLKKQVSGLVGVNPEGGKVARANAVQPYFAANNVFFPDPEGAVTNPEKSGEVVIYEWVEELKTEMLGFPFASNDDGVDMVSQALVYMGTRASRFLEAMRKLKQAGQPSA